MAYRPSSYSRSTLFAVPCGDDYTASDAESHHNLRDDVVEPQNLGAPEMVTPPPCPFGGEQARMLHEADTRTSTAEFPAVSQTVMTSDLL